MSSSASLAILLVATLLLAAFPTGTFCWQTSNLGSYVNSWNLASLTINGVDFTNRWVGSGSYPPAINGSWYISYRGNDAWNHVEVR